MGSATTNSKETSNRQNVLAECLQEVCNKVEASLLETIRSHTKSETNVGGGVVDDSASSSFEPKHGLDFLDAKNSLLLSYLIDLTYFIRQQMNCSSSTSTKNNNNMNSTNSSSTMCLHRLLEMKIALDKMLGLDKKLRYQIDKLLTAAANQQTYVTTGDEEDPLHFRPNADALIDNNNSKSSKKNKNTDDSSSSSGSDDEDNNGSDNENDIDDDDDLIAARKTLAMAKVTKTKIPTKRSNKDNNDDDNNDNIDDDGVYRAPRLQAVPYEHDQEDREANRQKRIGRRLRASEVAQTIRNQYTDAPETDDIHGGTQLGQQRAYARRIAEKQNEKTKFEEESMIRLTTTRLEKKEMKRMMRDETSNLNAISDLNNLARESSAFGFGGGGSRNNNDSDDDDHDVRGNRRIKKSGRKSMHDATTSSARHTNGIRKKQRTDRDGRVAPEKSFQAKNSLQAAMYGGGGNNSKKNKKRSSM
jgi:U3 small nucleolar ribonucleoprotein protein LCP5